MTKSYQYQCLDCNAILDLGEFSSKAALKVLYQAISNGQGLTEIKATRPKVWQLLFKDVHPLLDFLTEHSYYHGKQHQVCVITPEGRIFDSIGNEICPDCKDSLESIYYAPPFDPCYQKHVDYLKKKGVEITKG